MFGMLLLYGGFFLGLCGVLAWIVAYAVPEAQTTCALPSAKPEERTAWDSFIDHMAEAYAHQQTDADRAP